MAIVGCYSVDLYCDRGGDEFGGSCPYKPILTSVHAQYASNTERDCLRQARRDGWKFNKELTKAICPKCVREGVKP